MIWVRNTRNGVKNLDYFKKKSVELVNYRLYCDFRLGFLELRKQKEA